jgi:hypothetical protein
MPDRRSWRVVERMRVEIREESEVNAWKLQG